MLILRKIFFVRFQPILIIPLKNISIDIMPYN